MRPRCFALALGAASLVATGAVTAQEGSLGRARLTMNVLSGRADMVTCGDALVEVKGVGGGSLVVTLNGSDISGSFNPRGQGARAALVSGLPLGKSTLTAR